MSKSTKKSNPVIETVTRDEKTKAGVAESVFSQSEDAPVVKAVGYVKVPNSNLYLSYTIYIKGTQIVKIEAEEPNMLAIVEESAKLNFVNLFMNQD